MLAVELLHSTPASPRALLVLAALEQSAKDAVQLQSTRSYRGEAQTLVLWGPGAPDRMTIMARHVAAGGHVIAADLAYWDRDRKFRVSIDAAHPQRWVMRRDYPSNRFDADRVPVRNRWNPLGPVIIAGIGRKAKVQYGDAVGTWERQMLSATTARWPERPVLYRRKQFDAPVPSGVTLAPDRPIDQVLDGASLLITWHSNVAVDAIRNGIPVICQDGAAAAVCASTFTVEEPHPLPVAIRDRFLRNLAWFQWAPSEGQSFWRWATEVLA